MAIRIETIFHEARVLPPSERDAYLRDACGQDLGLRAKIDALLAADAQAGDFLKSAAAEGAATVDRAAATPPAEQPGQLIDRYKLLQQLGEGGMGTVFLAEQREPVKRRVALKVIKLGMDTKQVIARFEAERQALAMMEHPNIAKVFDAGETASGQPYFAMEYIRGVPIVAYCDQAKLDTRARLGLFAQVCQAIQHAHQKGIIHRDIKPGNVLVTLHDGVPVPKVIDFGVAKATHSELTQKTLFTEHRQMIGTPAYMSPEQAEMSGLDIDTRSDIYSLGVLLYELLTGTTPFSQKELLAKGYLEMMRIIREVEPHKPSTRVSTLESTSTPSAERRQVDLKKLGTILRGDLDWIVMKCLEKDRSRRYETANGLAMDIKRHLSDEPVTAGPPSAGYKLRKFVRRNRSQVIAGSLVVAALVLGVIGTTVGMMWAMNEKARADSEAESASLAAAAETEAKLNAQANEQRAIAEAERAERELARATEIKRLITEMLTSVSPEHAQGADTTLLKGILDDAAGRLASGEITDELVAADLHSVIGSVYSRLGLYDEAARHLPVAVEPLQRLLGPDHMLTLCTKTELATLFGAQSRYSAAEAIFADNLDRSKRVMGENAPFTLITMNNLADTYRSLGRYDDAERMLLTMQAIQKRTPGADLTLGLLTLGNLYIGMSRYAEAEVAYLELIKQLQKCVGGKHPETIGAMQNLAITYSHRNRFDEAAAIYEDALPLARRVLGPAHGTTVRILINLGFVQFRQGQLQDADEHLTEAMQHCRDLFGDEPHQLTFETMSVLVGLRAKQGRIEEAEALFEEIIDGRTTLYGLKHKDTLASMTNYGYFLNDQGRHHEALKMLDATVPLKREVLGPDHHFTHIAMRGLARTYEALDRPQDAIPLLDELLDYSVRTVDQTDAGMLNNTAWTLLTHEIEELRDATRALPLAERACALEETAGGTKLWMYLDTLALAQHLTGDTATAIETQKRALALIPADHAARAELEGRLAKLESALGKSSPGDTITSESKYR